MHPRIYIFLTRLSTLGILSVLFLYSCNEKPHTTSETQEMVEELKQLVKTSDPLDNYSWNSQLADYYHSILTSVPPEKKDQVWFQYCYELLRSGQIEKCIDALEKYLEKNNLTYNTSLDINLKDQTSMPVVALLALAYLRLGEVTNCRNQHNEHSCILPLQEEGQHVNKDGSKMAIEIYEKIYAKYPSDGLKWLLNLAHMTIGTYPNDVPESYRITYPNWEMEESDFPAFKEVAMALGIAQDGLSGGACFDDFNNDGLIDLFITSYGMEDQCHLFINTGSGFHESTEAAGLSGIVSGLNCIHADYDNDGNNDILILRGAWLDKGGNHPNSLLRNNGDGTFSDVTKSSGIYSKHPTQTAAWADINLDGHLDLFIGNETQGNRLHYCELFINLGDGTFIEDAAKHNLSKIKGFVKGVSFGDINNDGWPDLYISILGGKNRLFINEEGTFKDISIDSGVQAPLYSFPCWFWDVDNDGDSDLFVNSYDIRQANLADDFSKEIQGKKVKTNKSKLYLNNGDGSYKNVTKDYKLDKSMFTMGSNFGDLDNDGWLDFYIGTGAPALNSIIPNRMFRNNKGASFSEVTSAGRFGHIQKGHAISFADYDNDGDQDIYAVMGGAYEGDNFPNICFENPISDNNWIVLELEGTTSNRSAIGTRIKLSLNDGQNIYHTIGIGSSFGSNSLQAEIGIGQAAIIDSIKVEWQRSEAQNFYDIEVNKKYHLEEGSQLEQVSYEQLQMEMKNHKHKHH